MDSITPLHSANASIASSIQDDDTARQILLQRMSDLSNGDTAVAPALWGILRLCPETILQGFIDQLQHPDMNALGRERLWRDWDLHGNALVKAWSQKDKKKHVHRDQRPHEEDSDCEDNTENHKRKHEETAPSSPNSSCPSAKRSRSSNEEAQVTTVCPVSEKTSPSPKHQNNVSKGRSRKARTQTLARDHNRCVITKGGMVQICHILPHCITNDVEHDPHGPRHRFWDALCLFWGSSCAMDLLEIIGDKHEPHNLQLPGFQSPRNLITLSHSAHALWNEGHFAFRPIHQSTSHELDLQIYWARRQGGRNNQGKLFITDRPVFNSLASSIYDDHFSRLLSETGAQASELVKQGAVITLTTSDPVERPLPSHKLLELQWALTRIVHMVGAASMRAWSDYRDYPDDDGRGVGRHNAKVLLDGVNELDPVMLSTPRSTVPPFSTQIG